MLVPEIPIRLLVASAISAKSRRCVSRYCFKEMSMHATADGDGDVLSVTVHLSVTRQCADRSSSVATIDVVEYD